MTLLSSTFRHPLNRAEVDDAPTESRINHPHSNAAGDLHPPVGRAGGGFTPSLDHAPPAPQTKGSIQ